MSGTRIPALSIRRVTKRFGALTALDDVSLDVPDGQTLVLWGANGAGKTTLLRCVLGVVPFDGEIRVGALAAGPSQVEARRRIGYVPQDVRLHDQRTVGETAAFIARLRGVPADEASRLLADWGMAPVADRRVRALSGGMRQRLAVALALLGDPPILLLDEPTTHLDLHARREFSALLERLQRAGKTLVLSSHHAGDVWRLADRVAVLSRGRLIADGAPQAVADHLAEVALVEVTLEPSRRDEAVALLQAGGLTVVCNGTLRQLWVRVRPGGLLEPLQRLADARIPVFGVDVHSAPPAAPEEPQ
jgi:ABC-type multidrug transport system ATPase subunit